MSTSCPTRTWTRSPRSAASSCCGATDGEHHLADAFCPHLGAHLGVGGRVDDGCLVCPFHEWSFAADGANTDIPYADRPNRKARLRTYPTIERNRHLLAWYHPDPTVAPSWEVVEALPADPVECLRLDRTVRTAWQEVAENSVDMAHFVSVHGAGRVAEVGELTIEGRCAGCAARSRSSRRGASSRGPSSRAATARGSASSRSR